MMEIKDQFEACRILIEQALGDLALGTREPLGLYAPIRYVMQQGGAKRIRPVLTLLIQKYLCPSRPLVVEPALAIELFHNFTLLHDDVMDNSMTRRGNPSVFAKYGVNSAILSGDAMMVLSCQLLSKATPNLLPTLFSLFSEMGAKIMEGQQLDVDYETRTYVSEEEYLKMVGYKTAILIATACSFGAILSEVPENDIDVIYQFGWNLGIAFQLQDDYLDLYGEEETFGKPLGGDILEGKKTILHTLAFSEADETHRKALHGAMSMDNDRPKVKIKAVREIFDELEVPMLTQQRVSYYLDTAREALISLEPKYGKAAALSSLIDRLEHRNG